MKTKPLYYWFLLCLLAGCMEDHFLPELTEKESEEAFFRYSGTEYAVQDILTALKLKNDTTHFVADYLEIYGQPLWDKPKILPMEGETMVAFPVKKAGYSEIETIWFFIASGNSMIYFPFTKEMAPRMEADVAWMFDYFTQQVYPKRHYSTHYETNPEHTVLTKAGVWIEYCVNYSIEVEFQGQTSTKRGTHCWTEYYYLADNIPTIDHVEPPGGGGGSVWINNQGSWAGGSTPDIPPRTEQQKKKNLEAIYSPQSSLDESEKEALKEALDKLLDNPLFRDVFANLKAQGLQLKFSINPALRPDANAFYNAGDHSISFRTPYDIDPQYLEEELVHAAQHVIYGNDFHANILNFEFEAKLFRDVAHALYNKGGYSEIGSMNQSNSFMNEYSDLIKAITTAPVGFRNANLTIYYLLLKNWTGYPGIVDENLLPLLLYGFIR